MSNQTSRILKFLISCKPGHGRATMPKWTAREREPDYSGYMKDVGGEPRHFALWVGRPGSRVGEQGISIKVSRVRVVNGRVMAMVDGDEGEWVVGVDEEKGWVEHDKA